MNKFIFLTSIFLLLLCTTKPKAQYVETKEKRGGKSEVILVNRTALLIKSSDLEFDCDFSDRFKPLGKDIAPGGSDVVSLSGKKLTSIKFNENNVSSIITINPMGSRVFFKKYLLRIETQKLHSNFISVTISAMPQVKQLLTINHSMTDLDPGTFKIVYQDLSEYILDSKLTGAGIKRIEKNGKSTAIVQFRNKDGEYETVSNGYTIEVKKDIFLKTSFSHINNDIYMIGIEDVEIPNNNVPKEFVIFNQTNESVNFLSIEYFLKPQDRDIIEYNPLIVDNTPGSIGYINLGTLSTGDVATVKKYAISLPSNTEFSSSITPILFHDHVIGVEISNSKRCSQ